MVDYVMDESSPRLHVEQGATVYSDALRSYRRYVDGHIHTNGIENFWSLLKRSLGGTYISVEPFHLFRYLDEQSFRFNNRKGNDSERFKKVMEQVRQAPHLAEVTGKLPDDDKLSC